MANRWDQKHFLLFILSPTIYLTISKSCLLYIQIVFRFWPIVIIHISATIMDPATLFLTWIIKKHLLFFFLRFYLFIHERHREREAEGEAGSMQGVRCSTRFRIFRITHWAEGGTKPLSHRDCPLLTILSNSAPCSLREYIQYSGLHYSTETKDRSCFKVPMPPHVIQS